jgi:tetratricopeptide (TPR) repeat protein
MRIVLTSIVALLLASSAAAESVRELIERGNALYAEGDYVGALAIYEQAAERDDPRVATELLQNRAASYYRLGDLETARELWTQAKSLGDPAYEARARYNLGNVAYQSALAAQQAGDASAALEHLAEATEQYRAAVRLDAGLHDARANLELATTLRRQIQEMMQQQPQSQCSSQDSGENPESQPSGDQQQQNSEGESGDSADQRQQSQSDPSEESESDEQSEPQQSPPDTQPADQSESPPSDEQESPAPETQPAPQPAPETQPATTQPADSAQAAEIEMTPEQAARLLQMIRDLEQARRAELAQRRAAGQKPVERDW